MSTAVENAKQVLSELTAIHAEGWCACRSSTLPARVEAALSGLLSALSTPPADDVREAVMNALACHRRKVTVPAFNRPVCSCGWASTTVDYGSYAFDGHIADAVAAEVRPYGTVTDAEVKAAQRVADQMGVPVPSRVMYAALEAAREARS